MKILLSGASGLVGSALAPELRSAGHTVVRLVRRAPRTADEVRWDPSSGSIDVATLAGIEAAIHLSGENLTSGRWTPARKQSLISSRVDSTRLLAQSLAGLEPRPQVLITASAIGLYGDRGDERLSEASAPGEGFLADLGQQWEAAAAPAADAGIRVVHARFGLILTAAGGLLARLLPPFRWGLGGPIGNGRSWWSWIAIDDTVAALVWLIETSTASGAFNLVSPHPIRNRDFAGTLGRVLGRPAFLAAPAFAMRWVFGEMADAAILASHRVEPARLLEAGFGFRHTDLEPALRDLIDRA